MKFLDDGATYLGNQLECEFGGNRCFGIVCNMDFILVATYEENGENISVCDCGKQIVETVDKLCQEKEKDVMTV